MTNTNEDNQLVESTTRTDGIFLWN